MKVFFLIFLFSISALAFKVPSLTGPVVDQAKVINYDDEKLASEIIRKLYDSGQAQLVLVTIPSLEGQTIEQVGIQIADQWKLGSKDKDNGILLIAAVEDRAVRIEVGQGLEGTIPDAIANRIIEDIIVPTIRSSNLSSGLITGVVAIAQKIDPTIIQHSNKNAFNRNRLSGRDIGGGFGFLFFVIIILIIKFLNFITGGRIGGRRFRGSHWGGGGGFGGGFGGSGGFGGGGGGFSGGGASGRW